MLVKDDAYEFLLSLHRATTEGRIAWDQGVGPDAVSTSLYEGYSVVVERSSDELDSTGFPNYLVHLERRGSRVKTIRDRDDNLSAKRFEQELGAHNWPGSGSAQYRFFGDLWKLASADAVTGAGHIKAARRTLDGSGLPVGLPASQR